MSTIHLSKEWFNKTKEVNILGIKIKESAYFPFQMEDGTICHGVAFPDLDKDEVEPWSFYTELANEGPTFNQWVAGNAVFPHF
jgi:hypothetical protein